MKHMNLKPMDMALAVKYSLILEAANSTAYNAYEKYLEIESEIVYKTNEAFQETVVFTDGSFIEEYESRSIVYSCEVLKNTLAIILNWRTKNNKILGYYVKRNRLKAELPSFTFFSSPKEDAISFKNDDYIIIISAKNLEISGFTRIAY